MQKIVPHLWFDKEAKEATAFYVSIFKNSKINSSYVLHTPYGDNDVVNFEIGDYEIATLSGGPMFKLNPSISFMLNISKKEELDILWAQLIEGGKILMPLQEYPFSKWYGWVEDRFGVSWQLMLTDPAGEPRPFIVPAHLFSGKAKEATDFHLSVFKNSKRGTLALYPEGNVMYTDYALENQWFASMDAPEAPAFTFNEAFSLIIRCADQAEMDYFYEKLSAVPESEQCGWVKDKFGISWQVVTPNLDEMLMKGTPEQVARVMDVLMPMKRLDIELLEKAYRGE